MTRFTETQLDVLQGKARPKGSLPYLPDNADVETLRAWLTRALRPPAGWTVEGFERTSRDPKDAASLLVLNGRERRTFRFRHQSDLYQRCRTVILSESDSWLAVPHLTGSEIEDVWAALCRLGIVMTEHDERDEARKWVEQMLPATIPLRGYTLVPDGRHDALMALKQAGEFTRPDALALVRSDTEVTVQRPARFVDAQTGEQWLRAGETATYVRWVLGVEPLSHANLRARLAEVGVVGRRFEDYRPPHPKLNLYQLTEALIEEQK